jgi:hypothetical protein
MIEEESARKTGLNIDTKLYSVKEEIKFVLLEVINFFEVMIHSILYVYYINQG